MEEKTKIKRFSEKMRYKYRLSIMNESTYEERFAMKLSRLKVFTIIMIAVLTITLLVFLLIAYTPLREYIPGYGSIEERQQLYDLSLKTDSLEKELQARNVYFNSFFNVLLNLDSAMLIDSYSSFSNESISSDVNSPPQQSSGFLLSPLDGNIINKFNVKQEHFGVDISGEKDAFIHSIANGLVVFSDWTLDGGKTIVVQHSSNMISIYKHNSALLKKQGESVSSGESIAIIGNTGEKTSGPHLHFELWIDQAPVNPQNHISFK